MPRFHYRTITAFLFLVFLILMFATTLLHSRVIWANVQRENELYLEPDDKLKEIIYETISNLEFQMKDKFLFKSELIDINGLFQRGIHKNIIEDAEKNYTVYKMKNGQLTFNYLECDQEKMESYIRNMVKLNQYLTDKGTKLLYIQAPFKVNKFDSKLPPGVMDTTNVNADSFLYGLRETDVPYIDLRDAIHEKNFDYQTLFYHTDHHWKTETAFWAYQYVMEYFNRNYGMLYDQEKADDSNFKKRELKQAFLGSQAVRTGKYYAGVDDFTVITPNFDTNYQFHLFNGNLSLITSKSGDFETAMIAQKHLTRPDTVKTIRDCAYFDINPPKAKIVNNDVEEGKLLIIEDSFGRPFSAFMSLNFHQTDLLDLRYYKIQSLYEYLEKNEYDYVLFIYNPGVFGEENADDFFCFDSK